MKRSIGALKLIIIFPFLLFLILLFSTNGDPVLGNRNIKVVFIHSGQLCCDMDLMIGFAHVRNVLRLFREAEPDKEGLRSILREPYFVPEGTPLTKQLLNFQRERRRIGLVVDEYGDLLGLVTLEDILEEIVGEFTTDPSARVKEVQRQEDGSFLVDASASIRDLNRAFHWSLPTGGPKTLNGMIIEYLENIPEPGTSFLLEGHPLEVVQVSANAVKTVRISPQHVRRDQH